MTGKESYYTVYAGHEVMCHVSTMLPYSKDNPQQLERKRHIGNDIVNIIYTDDPSAIDTFNPNCIRSQFTRKLSEISRFYSVEKSNQIIILRESNNITIRSDRRSRVLPIVIRIKEHTSKHTTDAEIPHSAIILSVSLYVFLFLRP